MRKSARRCAAFQKEAGWVLRGGVFADSVVGAADTFCRQVNEGHGGHCVSHGEGLAVGIPRGGPGWDGLIPVLCAHCGRMPVC